MSEKQTDAGQIVIRKTKRSFHISKYLDTYFTLRLSNNTFILVFNKIGNIHLPFILLKNKCNT